MKKCIMTLCTILMLLCVSFGCAGCNKKKLYVENEEVVFDYSEPLNSYCPLTVSGCIINRTGKDLSYISVGYKVYDNNDVEVGIVSASTNDTILKGEVWNFITNFAAPLSEFYEKKPTKVKFDAIVVEFDTKVVYK